ncbi:MAG: porin [Geminicoccaceae bacterium]
MKKILLGSTALVGAVALAGQAYAFDLTLGGFQEFHVDFAEDNNLAPPSDRGYAFGTDTEVIVRGQDETDGGLTYGFKIELEADQTNTVNADEAGMFFSGGFGRIELGADDGADDNMSLGTKSIAAGTGGADGDQPGAGSFAVPKIEDTSDAVKITYFSPRIAGFQVGASFTPDSGDDGGFNFSGDDNGDLENHIGVGANYVQEFGGFDIGLAAVGGFADVEGTPDDDDDEDIDLDPTDGDFVSYSFTGTLGFGNFAIAGGYLFDDVEDVERTVIDAGVAFGFGPANVSFVYQNNDDDGIEFDDTANVYIGSADYGILPGVALQTDIQYTDPDNLEDFWSGIFQVAMSF